MLCSFYKNAYDNTGVEVNLFKIMDGIRDGKWNDQIQAIRDADTKKERKELKYHLPAATFSGTFRPTKKDANVHKYNRLVTVDIDSGDRKFIDKIKSQVVTDQSCFSAFISPSYGLKCLFKVEDKMTHQDHKRWSFMAIEKYFNDIYGVQIDKSGKNLARLCFVSYDPDLYLNPDATGYLVSADIQRFEKVQQTRVVPDADVCTDIQYIFKRAKEWTNKSGKFYRKGCRNDYIHQMACILNRAGLRENDIVLAICSNHSISNDMYREVVYTIEETCKRNSHEFGTNPIFVKKNKNQNSII